MPTGIVQKRNNLLASRLASLTSVCTSGSCRKEASTTVTMLQEQVLLFKELLNVPASFKASYDFLHSFKVRHRIKLLSIQRDKLYSDKEASQTFCQEIVQYRKNVQIFLYVLGETRPTREDTN